MSLQQAKQYFFEYTWFPTEAQLTTVGPTIFTVIPVKAGWRVLDVNARVMVAFHASSVIEVGDGGDDDGYIVGGNITEQTAGMYQGMGAYQAGTSTTGREGKLYTTDDTIDIAYTGDASAVAGSVLKLVARMERIF